jgi:hypothetical protein
MEQERTALLAEQRKDMNIEKWSREGTFLITE